MSFLWVLQERMKMEETLREILFKEGKLINYRPNEKVCLGTIETTMSKNSVVSLNFYNLYHNSISVDLIIEFYSKNNICQKVIVIESYLNEKGYQVTQKLSWLDDHKIFTQILSKNGISFKNRTTIHIARLLLAIIQNVQNLEVHHKDFIRNNNILSNLELLTQAEHKKIHRGQDIPHYHNDYTYKNGIYVPVSTEDSVLSNDYINNSSIGKTRGLMPVGRVLKNLGYKEAITGEGMNLFEDSTIKDPKKDLIENLNVNSNGELDCQNKSISMREKQLSKRYWNNIEMEDVISNYDFDTTNNIIPINTYKNSFVVIESFKKYKLAELKTIFPNVKDEILEIHMQLGLINIKNNENELTEKSLKNYTKEERDLISQLIELFKLINKTQIKDFYIACTNNYLKTYNNLRELQKEISQQNNNKRVLIREKIHTDGKEPG